MTSLAEYVEWTAETAVYPGAGTGLYAAEDYVMLGLISELGELASLLKREIRDEVTPKFESVQAELGDICWYTARLYVEHDRLVPDLDQVVEVAQLAYTDTPLARIRRIIDNDWSFGAVANLCEALGHDLHAVLQANMAKLNSRKSRGTIHGSGDTR